MSGSAGMVCSDVYGECSAPDLAVMNLGDYLRFFEGARGNLYRLHCPSFEFLSIGLRILCWQLDKRIYKKNGNFYWVGGRELMTPLLPQERRIQGGATLKCTPFCSSLVRAPFHIACTLFSAILNLKMDKMEHNMIKILKIKYDYLISLPPIV